MKKTFSFISQPKLDNFPINKEVIVEAPLNLESVKLTTPVSDNTLDNAPFLHDAETLLLILRI